MQEEKLNKNAYKLDKVTSVQFPLPRSLIATMKLYLSIVLKISIHAMEQMITKNYVLDHRLFK